MLSVYKKELRSYFSNMIGYVFIAAILVIVGIYMTAMNLNQGYPNFEYSFGSATFIFLFIVPILTMRSLSEERHSKTDQLLYSLPLSVNDIVIGKYLSMLTVFGIPCGVMCIYPIILGFYGTINYLATYGALLAFFLLGAALIAIGMFCSSLTESQVISAVLGFASVLFCYLVSSLASLVPTTSVASFIAFTVIVLAIALILWYMTKNTVITYAAALVLEGVMFILYMINSSNFAGLFNDVLESMSLFDRLNNFIYGMFDLTSIVYYITVIFLFVFLTSQSVEKRRWS